jgi:hypothetical protein
MSVGSRAAAADKRDVASPGGEICMTSALKFALIALACAAAMPGPAAAQANQEAAARPGIDDPLAWVNATYRPARPDDARDADIPDSQKTSYSPRLRAMFADDERFAHGEEGRLGFSPVTGSVDSQIAGFGAVARAVEGTPDRSIVTATFRNIGVPTTIAYYFQRIDGRWYVDDIASPGQPGAGGMPPWTLSLVLLYGH